MSVLTEKQTLSFYSDPAAASLSVSELFCNSILHLQLRMLLLEQVHQCGRLPVM